jgi:hypothetical protein
MRLFLTGLALLVALGIQAQEIHQDTLVRHSPVFLPAPFPEYWMQDSLREAAEIQAAKDSLARSDSIARADSIAMALSDSLFWNYLYRDADLEKDPLCIIGTGDIMLGTSYPSEDYLPPGGECSSLLSPVHQVLQSGDLLFGNLEGVFCAEGGTPKNCRDPKTCYVFRMQGTMW